MWSRYVAGRRTNGQGQFALPGLPGGRYLAIGVPSLVTGEWQDPEFLKRQRGNPDVVRFTLVDEGTQTITLMGRK
ncbi:MAG TPA: hypothetical protein VFV78_14370 [Vicinamibacterales bacterium]|nr:hypothetical protein [Vicinamibacterales bacterium]